MMRSATVSGIRAASGVAILFACTVAQGAPPKAPSLPGTGPLTASGDLSAQMVAGIDRFLTSATDASVAGRAQFWKRDFSSPGAYAISVEPNRQRLRAMTGAVDELLSPARLEYVSGPDHPAVIAETDGYRVYAIRWTVFDGVDGEGLLLEPKTPPLARIVAIPDADETPEMLAGLAPGIDPDSQFARRLAEMGCQVIVPVLIDRENTSSGNPDILMTDQTHREWVCRPAIEMGRHLIGYEVRKIEAAAGWLHSRTAGEGRAPIGVAGFGEGGLLALYAAALDERIEGALVSGYFESRQELWREPFYRNLFGLLRELGDAEVASLVAPRPLVIEHSAGPRVEGPPPAGDSRRKTAAPGRLLPQEFASVKGEIERARGLCAPDSGEAIGAIELVAGRESAVTGPGSESALRAFLSCLGVAEESAASGTADVPSASDAPDTAARQRRQVAQLIGHSQRLLRRAETIRAEFWKEAVPESAAQWPDAIRPYKEHLWNEILGKLPDPAAPPNPRSRLLEEHDNWTTHEIMLDVWPPDVFAWGYLLVPKDIAPGERRPVIVCQHGLEGLPASVIAEDETSREWRAYRAYANQLAERGFVVYAPHNPYRGGTAFRQLQRKANPLKLTLYSFILGQHQRTLEWLSSLPFVDAERIGFYGLSYGGVSAVRIPALLDGYCLSICSAAFNDWTRKIMSPHFRSAYVFTGEYDHFTFGLGAAFDNAELAALIAPRPFMVERGHNDGVAPDEWVASEFSKVRRHYARLGIPDRTAIEFFDGGHTINGRGTFEFLHRHLDWPK